MSISRTIIISCAGMGNRLGIGITKALVMIDGKPLILHQLEHLKNEKDIRIVVGYQAEKVINVVKEYRDDITFVFNHDYKHTGTGASVSLASAYANDYILSWDGDLLVHPEDVKKLLACEDEFIGGCISNTEDPWLLKLDTINNKKVVTGFSHTEVCSEYEWTGLVQIKRSKITSGTGHVYQLLEPHLPIPLIHVRCQEIDTIGDYEHAVQWIKNNYN